MFVPPLFKTAWKVYCGQSKLLISPKKVPAIYTMHVPDTHKYTHTSPSLQDRTEAVSPVRDTHKYTHTCLSLQDRTVAGSPVRDTHTYTHTCPSLQYIHVPVPRVPLMSLHYSLLPVIDYWLPFLYMHG